MGSEFEELRTAIATFPSLSGSQPHLVIQPTYKDPVSGALYVHQDLQRVQEPWAEEAHTYPMSAAEHLGDVEGWVAYVRRFGRQGAAAPLLTWNSRGFSAVIDYASAETKDGGGRRKWTATHPFAFSAQWAAWTTFANGQAMAQRPAVEKLEDLAEDIVEPSPADLVGILRNLRASVNANAEAELRPDGSTSVAFAQDTAVRAGRAGSVDLPPTFAIAIPILRGHLAEGRPVLYRLAVRVRASVDESAHLSLRFSIPSAVRLLEDVYADRVRLAASLLGEEFALLRASE